METVVDCAVEPFDQSLPAAADEVSVTLPPWQNSVGPSAEMVGAAGIGFTVTVVPAEVAEVHPALVTNTVYVPEAETVMDCVVAPFDQVFPVAEEDVSTTSSPAQKVNGPPAEIVGVAGAPGSVSACDSVFEGQPLLNVMEYVPAPSVGIVAGSVIPESDPVAEPDQLRSPVPVPVTSMLPVVVAQAVGLVTVPIAITGNGLTVTVVPAEVAEVQLPAVTETVYVPEVETVMDCVVAPVDHKLPEADEDVNVTLSPAQNVNGPPALMVGVAGVGFTVTIVPAEVAEVQLPDVTETVYVPEVETVIDCVVAPVDHRFPEADEDVNVTLPPEQKVVGPPGVIVGVAGVGFTVTVVPAEVAEVQPPVVTETVYVPEVETVIDCVVAPVDQLFPVAEDEVNVTLPPEQNVSGPPALMVGVAGVGFTVTVVPAEAGDVQPPVVCVTVYVPEVETVMDCVVAPVDHRFPEAADEVNVTLPPEQKVVGPPGVIVGVDGVGFTVTVVPAETGDVQPPVVWVTVYVPEVETVMDCVVAPVDHKFPEAADEVSTTLPPEQNVVGPPGVIVGADGVGFTVTITPADAGEVQPAVVRVTVYVPEAETVMACVVAPVDHKLPEAADEVNVTLPPEQKVVGPPGVIVGAAGVGFTVTVVPAETGDVQPLVVWVTVYVPEVETVMDCVVAPVDHKLPEAADEVSTTLPPEQNVVGPPGVMVGADGIGFTVTVTPAEAGDVQPLVVCVTVYVPEAETVMACVVAPVDHKLPEAAEDVRVTLPPVQRVVGPPGVIVGAVGTAFTVM